MKHFSLFTKFVLALGLSTVCLSPANAMQELKKRVVETRLAYNNRLIENFGWVMEECTKAINQARQLLVDKKASVDEFENLIFACKDSLQLKIDWIQYNPTISAVAISNCLELAENFKKEQLEWLNNEKLQPQILPEVVAEVIPEAVPAQVSPEVVAVANKGIVRGLATKIVSLVHEHPLAVASVATFLGTSLGTYLGLSYGAQFIPVK